MYVLFFGPGVLSLIYFSLSFFCSFCSSIVIIIIMMSHKHTHAHEPHALNEQKNHARFLDNILNELRPEPEYFRVGYYGRGFPSFLRNKVFVYRGLEYEKMATFSTRLQSEFPQSQLLKKSGPPDESIIASECQFLQICSVKPVPEPRPEFEGRDVPDKILAYYLTNDVRTFIFDRPIHKGPADPENEFKSLWIERSTLTTAAKLPGILRWSEVMHKRVTELSPLEHACESVENMNRELERLVQSYMTEPGKQISPLSMRLQGVIEAAVNGGIAKYQDAFFNPKYINLHPEQGAYIRRLKQLIMQKVRILEGGLSIHGRHAPVAIQPLHMRLVERFSLMRQSILDSTSHVLDSAFETLSKRPSILNTPLPPIPRAHHQPPTRHHPVRRNGSLSSGGGGGSSLPIAFRDETDDLYALVSGGSLEPSGRQFDDDTYAVPMERTSDRGSGSYSHSSAGSNSLRLEPVNRNSGSGGEDQVPAIPERNSPAPPPPLPPTRARYPDQRASPGAGRPPVVQNGSAGHESIGVNPPLIPSQHQLQRTRSMPRTTMTPQPQPQQQQMPQHQMLQQNVLTVANSNFYSPDPTARSSPTSLASTCLPVAAPPLPPRSVPSTSTLERHRSVDGGVGIPEDMRPNLPKRTTLRKAISTTGQMESPVSPASGATATTTAMTVVMEGTSNQASLSQRLVTSNGSLTRRPAPSPPSLASNPPVVADSSSPPPTTLPPPPPPHPLLPTSTSPITTSSATPDPQTDDQMSGTAGAATSGPRLPSSIICDHEVESLPASIAASSAAEHEARSEESEENMRRRTTVTVTTTSGDDVGSSISVVSVVVPHDGSDD